MSSYNHGEFIDDAIKSIQRQTHSNWELFIVDDGSTDNTSDVVHSINDSRIKFLQIEHQGIRHRIKNTPFDIATGEFIAIMDSDDMWATNKIEVQLKALESCPDAGFSITNGCNFRKKGEFSNAFLTRIDGCECRNIFEAHCKGEIPAFFQTLLIRKSCFDKIDMQDVYDNPFRLFGHLTFYFDAVLLYPPLLFRRLHERNVTVGDLMSSDRRMLRSLSIDLIRSYRDREMLSTHASKIALFKLHTSFGDQFLSAKHYSNASRQYLSAFLQQPFNSASIKRLIKVAARCLTNS